MSEMQPSDKRSWWDRNWAWFVPVGCIGGCVLFAVAIVAFVGGLLWIIFGTFRSSEIYAGAIDKARSHPEVIRELGEPIEQGWWITGSVNVSGTSGEADFGIPISGPRGSAMIYVVAEKKAGKWSFDLLEVEIDGRKDRIDLLEDADWRVSRPGEAPRTTWGEPPRARAVLSGNEA